MQTIRKKQEDEKPNNTKRQTNIAKEREEGTRLMKEITLNIGSFNKIHSVH